MEKKTLFYILLAFLGSSFVGLAPLFVRCSGIGPVGAGFYRICLSLPFLFLWMKRGKRVELLGRDWVKLALYGGLFALDLSLWNLSLSYTSVANASLFNNFAAFVVPLLLFIFYKELPTSRYLQGGVLALLGSFLLMKGSLNFSISSLFGDSLALLSAVAYGGYLIIIKELRSKLSSGHILFFGGIFALAALFTIAIVKGESLRIATTREFFLLFAFALFAQLLGQGLIAYSMGRLSSKVVGLVLLTQPIVSTLLAYFLLGESVALSALFGGALILTSLFWAQERKGLDTA
ncbi:MAG: DMT family transporter [Simkaniaceae bacterium]